MVADIDWTEDEGRCAIVVDKNLPAGRAANAAAVIALTLGKRNPRLAGRDLIDASGMAHPGLIPIGIAVLAADGEAIREVRAKGMRAGVEVVDFPIQGQETNDYGVFGERVASVPTGDLCYAGVGLFGARKVIGRIVGRYPLLR
jgi:hypothetical protein